MTTTTERPPEQEIYRRLWETEAYRTVSPGEEGAVAFLQQAQPKRGAAVLDLGCGTGRGGLMLAIMGGLDVTLVDFAVNCLDPDIRAALKTQSHTLRFVEADLTERIPVTAIYGYCVDVMEHISPERVEAALDNILMACRHVWFQIATGEDVCGELVGHPLHLTQHDYAWWQEQFRRRDCIIHYSHDGGSFCRFYVSAWTEAQAVVDAGVLNCGEEQIRENVRRNIANGWQQVVPHETQDTELMILGGGPGLKRFENEIQRRRAKGMRLVTLNGAYNWCLERGMTPSCQIIVDARPFNARFTKPVTETTTYLICSQCDPSVLEGLPPEQTWLWHTTAECCADILSEHYPIWYGIPGGSTVLLRAIPLLRMLGYKRFHLYGCESCLSGQEHHAFTQTENDSEIILPVELEGRMFHCHPWMAAQGQEFISLIRALGEEIGLKIYGDGLLAHILNTGAALWEEKEKGHVDG